CTPQPIPNGSCNSWILMRSAPASRPWTASAQPCSYSCALPRNRDFLFSPIATPIREGQAMQLDTTDRVPRRRKRIESTAHDHARSGFSVRDLCRRWKVGADKIRGFLDRGELIGLNLAADLSGRPQWRITLESVEAFERRRSSVPPLKPPPRRRKRTDE